MKIISIIPFKKGLLKGHLTYFSSKSIELGSIVEIDLRNKKNLGLVVGSSDVLNEKSSIKGMSFDLKKISGIKETSIINQRFLETVIDVSKYYLENISTSLSSLLPKAILENHDELSKLYEKEQLGDAKNNFSSEKLIFQRNTSDRIEFYKTFISSNFAEKKSIFIVVPTKQHTEEWFKHLSKGLESFTYKIHGGLTLKNQITTIESILKNDHPVLVIATAPYLSIIDHKFKTIILENESNSAYKMMIRPFFDLRFFVETFASKSNKKIIFGDSILKIETLARLESGEISELQPSSYRIDFKGKIEIIKREKEENKDFSVFGKDVLNKINNSILNKEKVFLFSLRKGLAPYTVCRNCGEMVCCKNCLNPMSLYKLKNGKNIFVCNKCGEKSISEIKCANCQSWDLLPLGISIGTVLDELKKKIPNTETLIIDKQNTKSIKEVKKVLGDFKKENTILLGTELATLYLEDKVDTSIIVSFDSLWNIPNYKMGEKILQIILRIINNTKDTLIIQTKNADDPILLAVKSLNLNSYIKEELNDRKALNYPPFNRFIKVSFVQNTNTKENIENILKEYRPVFYKSLVQNTQKSGNFLIKVNPKDWYYDTNLKLNSKLRDALIETKKQAPDVSIEIDPENLV